MPFKQLESARQVTFGESFISFVTDPEQINRIQLRYYFDETRKIMYAEVVFGNKAQGPPGHAHGGAISAVFDELMGATCWFNGSPALTAQYTTRFYHTLPLRVPVLFQCQIAKKENQKLSLKAFVGDGDKLRYASAKGLFIEMNDDKFNALFNKTVSNAKLG
jgi:acyl-coenzyme A thioesterase PaaI-like protein